ncbi:hypothetical protein N7501_004117 [Penicillium viridicatum]|nr:hypothetical protein N7501_004117 [Penicillium viridicatum]
MGPVSMFTYIIFEPLFIRLENKFEAKASKSPEVAATCWKIAQLVRNIGKSITHSEDDPEYITWAQNVIDLDIRLREIVQREAFLINQCEKAEELLNDPKRQQQLDEWHMELRNLEQSYWKTERMLYANDLLCPVGPSWRAYISLRKIPQWYLIPCLVEDCARRGGCCGRACGCCSKPRSFSRSNGHGHCTKMCGCCLRVRGFSLDKEQEKLCQPKIDVKRALDDGFAGYDRSMLSAYTFGFGVPRERILPMLK